MHYDIYIIYTHICIYITYVGESGWWPCARAAHTPAWGLGPIYNRPTCEYHQIWRLMRLCKKCLVNAHSTNQLTIRDDKLARCSHMNGSLTLPERRGRHGATGDWSTWLIQTWLESSKCCAIQIVKPMASCSSDEHDESIYPMYMFIIYIYIYIYHYI